MSAKIFYQEDCNLALLEGKTIAIIGYGSQGHAHALNLKESGCHVIIGLYKGHPPAPVKTEKDHQKQYIRRFYNYTCYSICIPRSTGVTRPPSCPYIYPLPLSILLPNALSPAVQPLPHPERKACHRRAHYRIRQPVQPFYIISEHASQHRRRFVICRLLRHGKHGSHHIRIRGHAIPYADCRKERAESSGDFSRVRRPFDCFHRDYSFPFGFVLLPPLELLTGSQSRSGLDSDQYGNLPLCSNGLMVSLESVWPENCH